MPVQKRSYCVTHRVRIYIADLFHRKKIYEVFEEVHYLSRIDNNGQNRRRADIIVIEKNKNHGLILDPKIRWETNDPQQDYAINEEKINKSMNHVFRSFKNIMALRIGKCLDFGWELKVQPQGS